MEQKIISSKAIQQRNDSLISTSSSGNSKGKGQSNFVLGRRKRLKNKLDEVMKIRDMDEEYKAENTVNIENQNINNSVSRNFVNDNSIMFSNSKDRTK